LLCALPLASLAERLGWVTEQLALYTNDTLGGLLNASFGNATEVIIAAFAIKRRYLRLVKLTLLGSIVSNLLLVLGCAFVAGGVAGHATQRFNRQGAAVNVGLLMLASVAVALPTLLSETTPPEVVGVGVVGGGGGGGGETAAAAPPPPTTATGGLYSRQAELSLSRFESVLMLACYALFLVFQLFTHRHLYEEDKGGRRDQGDDDDEELVLVARRGGGGGGGASGGPADGSVSREASFAGFVVAGGGGGGAGAVGAAAPSATANGHAAPAAASRATFEVEMGSMVLAVPPHHHDHHPNNHHNERTSLLGGASGGVGGNNNSSSGTPAPLAPANTNASSENDNTPEMSLSSCLVWMALVTLAIAFLSDAITAVISDAAQGLRIPLPFLATIVLPIVGNAAEHFSAVTFAARNRIEISLGVAVGSSTQVAVLVVPFCVVLAWAMGAPLDLNFYSFEAFVLFASVILAGAVVQDGTGNWLKGALLLVSYLFVAGGFWVHRDASLEEEGGVVAHRRLL
jgi:Ca2+:H+ antiporter